MKVLWILTLFFSISLHAQSLIGLIDRSNDNHPSLAEGHNMSISGLVRGSGTQKTTGTAQDFILMVGMNHHFLMQLYPMIT